MCLYFNMKGEDMEIIRFILALGLVYLGGKLVQQLNLPAILAWLVVGMMIGPHMLNILSESVQATSWYTLLTTFSQLIVGVMIGSSLIFEKIKKAGGDVLTLSVSHMAAIFLIVSLSFAMIFYFQSTPLIVALILGLIAMATAPAPALSVINEYDTDGPLTRAVVPMTVLNSVLVNAVFFTVITLLQSIYADSELSIIATLAYMFIIPIVLGLLLGYATSRLLKNSMSSQQGLLIFVGGLIVFLISLILLNNYLFPKALANFILAGAGYAAGFVNAIPTDQSDEIGEKFSLIQSAGLMLLIMNLAAPLNPRLMISAGIWSIIYIVVRLLGSILGGYIGARLAESPEAVKKYIGLLMLPHSGVSLILTAVATQALSVIAPSYSGFVGTLVPAAAILNEIIAILISKKAYEWAGEIGQQEDDDKDFIQRDSSYRYVPKEDLLYQNTRHKTHRKRLPQFNQKS